MLFLCAFITFLPCLNNNLTWDDFTYIRDNASIRELSLHNLKTIFTSSINGSYHPLTQLSFAIEYHFVGLSPWLYHLDNIILHAVNAGLVFCLIRLFASTNAAFITALLFCIHPLRVESVAWISERKDVLSSFFYLYALIQYSLFVNNRSKEKRRFHWCLGSFILAVLSKPQASSLPLVLLTIDYLFSRKWELSLIKEKALFFFISLLSVSGAVLGGNKLFVGHRILGAGAHFGFIDKLFFSAYAFLLYVYKCILPLDLSVIYFYPSKVNGYWPLPVYLAPLVILMAFIILRWINIGRPVIWAVSLFCISIALPLGNIWMGGNLIADRYTYLPSIGLFLIMATVFLVLNERYRFVKWILLAYVCFLFVLSFSRCGIWKDYLTMTSEIIRQHPDADAYDLRGEIYNENKQFGLGLNDFNNAIALNPNDAIAYYNRGVAYYNSNERAQASQDLDQAIRLQPSLGGAYNDRAIMYFQMGDYVRCRQDVQKAQSLGFDVDKNLLEMLSHLR